MRSEKTKKLFGILLTTVLFLQLSYHTLHVFTQHGANSHIEHTTHDSQIDKISLTCELCTKLLGQTQFLWVYPALVVALMVSTMAISVGESFFRPALRANYLLRGPPALFI